MAGNTDQTEGSNTFQDKDSAACVQLVFPFECITQLFAC